MSLNPCSTFDYLGVTREIMSGSMLLVNQSERDIGGDKNKTAFWLQRVVVLGQHC
jgi:hypothetical protein